MYKFDRHSYVGYAACNEICTQNMQHMYAYIYTHTCIHTLSHGEILYCWFYICVHWV